MIIQIKDYTMTPCDHAKERFDLTKKIIRTRESDGEKYEDQESAGFGMSFQSCIEQIIALELDKDTSIVSLREYVDAFKAERKEITKILE